MSALEAAGAAPARAIRALRWAPEWPFALVAVLAWVVVAVGAVAHGGGASAGPAEHRHAAHAAAPASGNVIAELPAWAGMSAAMMLPVTLPAVRHVGLNSVRRRRRRAMAVYVAVYLGVWMAFGVVALAAARAGRDGLGVPHAALLAAALALAAGWQLAPAKRRAVVRCRRTVPLPPVGLRADVACGRFAVVHAGRCVVSCWALMLVMAVAGHASLAWMAAVAVVVALEELTLVGRRLFRPSAAVLAAAAALVLVL